MEAVSAFNRALTAHPSAPDTRAALERAADARFGAARQFVVYGSLAPGRPNHAALGDLHGEWTQGWVTGDLVATGWGAALGYPALRWRPDGPHVDAWLLQSVELPAHWPRLDALEGPDYQRILAPFWTPAGIVAVGYLYAAADAGRPLDSTGA